MKKSGKKGFLLLEVVVTITIISVGLMLIMRSFFTSLNALKRALKYTQAIYLAEEKMIDLKLTLEKEGIRFLEDEGEFPENKEFKWNYQIKSVLEEKLNELILTVAWIARKDKGEFSLSSYLKSLR